MATIAEKSRTKEIINRLQGIINNASSVPLTSGIVAVRKDEVQSLLTELEMQMDMEIKTYHETNDRKGKIINDAKKEAEKIIYEAEHSASRMRVSKRATSVAPLDYSRLDEEERNALGNANEIYAASLIYTDEMLTEVNDLIADVYQNIRSDYEIILQVLDEKLSTLSNNRQELMVELQEMEMEDRGQQILEIGQLLSNELYNERMKKRLNSDEYDDGSVQLSLDLQEEQAERAKQAEEQAMLATQAFQEMKAERDALMATVEKMKREGLGQVLRDGRSGSTGSFYARKAAVPDLMSAGIAAEAAQAAVTEIPTAMLKPEKSQPMFVKMMEEEEISDSLSEEEIPEQVADTLDEEEYEIVYVTEDELEEGEEYEIEYVDEEEPVNERKYETVYAEKDELTGTEEDETGHVDEREVKEIVENEVEYVRTREKKENKPVDDGEYAVEYVDEADSEEGEEYEVEYVDEADLEEGEEYEIEYVDEADLEEGEEYEIEYVDETKQEQVKSDIRYTEEMREEQLLNREESKSGRVVEVEELLKDETDKENSLNIESSLENEESKKESANLESSLEDAESKDGDRAGQEPEKKNGAEHFVEEMHTDKTMEGSETDNKRIGEQTENTPLYTKTEPVTDAGKPHREKNEKRKEKAVVSNFDRHQKVASAPSGKIAKMAKAMMTEEKYSGLIQRAVVEREKEEAVVTVEEMDPGPVRDKELPVEDDGMEDEDIKVDAAGNKYVQASMKFDENFEIMEF